VDEYSVWAGAAKIQGLQFDGFTYPVFTETWIGSE
jgi:hypothetical protein